jgi:hypothetical protein
MRKSVVVLLSTIAVGVMMAMPLSAGAKIGAYPDRAGDIGKTIICGGQGSHEWGDMLSYWSGDSPLANAGYVDMLSEWVSIKGSTVTVGMTLASPIPVNGNLPDGVKEVRWAWLFWTTIDTTTSSNNAPYGVYVMWNQGGLTAALVDRSSGTEPFAVTNLDSLVVDGCTLSVSIGLSSLTGAFAWFAETQAWNSYPSPLEQKFPWASWVLTDITDYQGSLAIYWPWVAMP